MSEWGNSNANKQKYSIRNIKSSKRVSDKLF